MSVLTDIKNCGVKDTFFPRLRRSRACAKSWGTWPLTAVRCKPSANAFTITFKPPIPGS